MSKEKWIEQVNPIIRGKVNYFLTLYEASKKMQSIESSCFFKAFGKELLALDGFTRQRLRVVMVHNHPGQRKGAMKTKWNNEFFAKIGIIPSYWYYYHKIYGFSLESCMMRMKMKQQNKQKRQIQRVKENGQEYYTSERIRKINYVQRLATYNTLVSGMP